MQAEARSLAETLLAVTLSATASVDAGDWDMAGQLLRRREQLLTQIENCSDAAGAIDILKRVQSAELELGDAMEIATRETLADMNTARDARNARKLYRDQRAAANIIERVG